MMTVLLLLVSCSDEKESTSEIIVEPSSDSAVEIPEEETPPEITEGIVGEGSLYPNEEQTYRNKKRMSIDHVKASMERVSGGIAWQVSGRDKWSDYSDTLGVPDFLYSVREDRTVSVMFHKFLDDAAVHTCGEWIQQEWQSTERIFFTEVEPEELDLAKIRLNMVALRRQIHGAITPINDPMIDSLVDLHFTVVQRTDSLEQAWTSVCVGLFTHPDFFMY